MNITANKATITNNNGFFAITVKLNDTLVFSAVQFKKKRVVVTQDILELELVSVPLDDGITELDEVVVTPYNLTGDISKDLRLLKQTQWYGRIIRSSQCSCAYSNKIGTGAL